MADGLVVGGGGSWLISWLIHLVVIWVKLMANLLPGPNP